jgi:hypothetical protein
MMETARAHLGIEGRQSKHKQKHRVLLTDGSRSDPMYLHEHPSALLVPRMNVPTVHFRKHETEDLPPAISLWFTPMGQDMMERARKIGGEINLTRGLDASEFYRFIAKIAHSFAIAELGFTFHPYLLNLIELRPPLFASHFIGGHVGENRAPGLTLHEIEFSPSLVGPAGDELIMVRIRLFASLGAPDHYAVVGSRWPESHSAPAQ